MGPQYTPKLFEKCFRCSKDLKEGDSIGVCVASELSGVSTWLVIADGKGGTGYSFKSFETSIDKSEMVYEGVKWFDELKAKYA